MKSIDRGDVIMTPSKGDFLKAIIKLGGGERQVSNKDIAKELKSSRGEILRWLFSCLSAAFML